MRVRTFKEKVKDSYLRNRNKEEEYTFLILDDIKERLIGNIVMLKAHPSDKNSTYNISTLKNLFYITDVLISKEELDYSFVIEPMFPRRYSIDERLPSVVEKDKIYILTSDIYNEIWFINGLAYNTENGFVDIPEDGIIYKINKRNANAILKEVVNSTIEAHKRFNHICVMGVDEEVISYLNTKRTNVLTKYNNIITMDNVYKEITFVFKNNRLTAKGTNVSDFFYREKPL